MAAVLLVGPNLWKGKVHKVYKDEKLFDLRNLPVTDLNKIQVDARRCRKWGKCSGLPEEAETKLQCTKLQQAGFDESKEYMRL